jgi:RNA polymerase sigma factor (sigma-70 family)
MMRNREEAADVTQDTFVRVMRSLPTLREGTAFRGWIFTIARNTALNRIEQSGRTRPLAMTNDDGEEAEFDVIDSSRFSDPSEAASAGASAALVWEAAAALTPQQYSLLDLHVRQGLDSGEIATVLGVSKNSAYVMMNRLKGAVTEAIEAYVMLHAGRGSCAELDAELRRVEAREVGGLSPKVRRAISAHVSTCDTCQATRAQHASPLSILGAFVPVSIDPTAKDAMLSDLLSQWPAAPPASPPSSGLGNVARRAWEVGNQHATLTGALVAGLGVLMLLVALILPGAPLHDGVFGGNATATDGPASITVRVVNAAGVPQSGVSVAAAPVDPGEPFLPTQFSNASGSASWDDVDPGFWIIAIDGVPAVSNLPSDQRRWRVELSDGEQVEITATVP